MPGTIRAARRAALAGAVIAAITFMVPNARPAVAAGPNLHVSPAAAKPGTTVIASGTIPSEAGTPYTVTQLYTNGNVARISQPEPMGGVADASGHVHATVTVPTGAARSDILRPYGSWQYDEVIFSFPAGCPPQSCTSYGVNVNVLPIRTDEKILLGTLSPRTGSQVTVRVENCVGGVATEFARVIDGNGVYFPFTGTFGGTTFTGSADLAHGFRGKYGPMGAAHVSSPLGTKDALAAVPCVQSEGPPSVAQADVLEHESVVVDLTICPVSGACHVNNAALPVAAGMPPETAATASQASVVPAAPRAAPITAQPSFVG